MAQKHMIDLETKEQEMLTGMIASGTQQVRKVNHAQILLAITQSECGTAPKQFHIPIVFGTKLAMA